MCLILFVDFIKEIDLEGNCLIVLIILGWFVCLISRICLFVL